MRPYYSNEVSSHFAPLLQRIVVLADKVILPERFVFTQNALAIACAVTFASV